MNETLLTTEPAERTARRISSDWLALAEDLQKWNGKGSARHQRFLERFQQLQDLFDRFAEEVRGLDSQQRRSLRQTRESVGQCYREFCELRDLFSKEHAEMGRIGGMLKMIIKPNEGLREFYPQEFLEVVKAIRYLERSSKRLKTLEAKLNGNHQASHQ